MIQDVFRSENDTTNPALARVYGPAQSTTGRVRLFDRDGDRTKFILFLAQGGRYGCDGLNEYHYKGFLVPEFEEGHDGDEAFRNWKFYPGLVSRGFTDPVQGRPVFFDELDETFSGKCYLSVKLPASLSPAEGELPNESEVFLRGLRVMRYELEAGLLQETTPACTDNNAWVGMDVLREVRGLPLSRLQPWAQTWIDYEARSDGLIEWDKGTEAGGIIKIPRFEANCVFPNSLSPIAAFQTVIDRSPGTRWFDANGGIGILPDPDRASVHEFNSFNVLKKGVTMTPPDLSSLYNYFLGVFRDRDSVDPDTGQLLYAYDKAEVDLAGLRDAAGGGLRVFRDDLGGGPMRRSLAERIMWYQARRLTAVNAHRDMIADEVIYPVQFEVKGQMDSFHVAKFDYATIADHYLVGLQAPLCEVLKETTHPKRGERTFSLQLTATDVYRDTDHSIVKGSSTLVLKTEDGGDLLTEEGAKIEKE